MKFKDDHKRIEVLLDATTDDQIQKIADESCTTRSFIIRKAIRIYLEQRMRSATSSAQGGIR